MSSDYLTVREAQRELAAQGYRVTTQTIRNWCERCGFGFRLVPGRGPWRIARSKLDLKAISAGETATAA
jgi:hypothetical protein